MASMRLNDDRHEPTVWPRDSRWCQRFSSLYLQGTALSLWIRCKIYVSLYCRYHHVGISCQIRGDEGCVLRNSIEGNRKWYYFFFEYLHSCQWQCKPIHWRHMALTTFPSTDNPIIGSKGGLSLQQRKHERSVLLGLYEETVQWLAVSRHKGSVMRKRFPCHTTIARNLLCRTMTDSLPTRSTPFLQTRFNCDMMTSSNGNIFRVTGPLCGVFTGPGESPTQRPVTRSFDVFFHLRLNKRLRKQPWGWWFETPSWSLWRQCND